MRLKTMQPLLLLLVAVTCAVHGQQLTAPAKAGGTARTGTMEDGPVKSEGPDLAEPEDGTVAGSSYDNKYFALRYPVPLNWTQTVRGAPPSDAGYYVLDLLKRAESPESKLKGTILIAAWDLFFVPRPAKNALELVQDIHKNLPQIYEIEAAPAEVKLAGHAFVRFDYGSSAAQLHWKVLATEIRCHMVEFVFTGQDVGMLEDLVRQMNKLGLPEGADAVSGTGGGPFPVCIKDYASGANVLHKVDPVMVGARFTNVPVRFIVGADGKAHHIHVISASPEQAKSARDALAEWSFKPFMENGAPREVETGILFKFPPEGVKLPPIPEKY